MILIEYKTKTLLQEFLLKNYRVCVPSNLIIGLLYHK